MKLEAFGSDWHLSNCTRRGLCVLRISLLSSFALSFVSRRAWNALVLRLFSALHEDLRNHFVTESRNRSLGGLRAEQYLLEFPPKHEFGLVGILGL